MSRVETNPACHVAALRALYVADTRGLSVPGVDPLSGGPLILIIVDACLDLLQVRDRPEIRRRD